LVLLWLFYFEAPKNLQPLLVGETGGRGVKDDRRGGESTRPTKDGDVEGWGNHAYRALAFTINGRGAAPLEKKILEDVKI